MVNCSNTLLLGFGLYSGIYNGAFGASHLPEFGIFLVGSVVLVNLIAMVLLKKIPPNDTINTDASNEKKEVPNDDKLDVKKTDEKDNLIINPKPLKIVRYGDYTLSQALKTPDFHRIMWPIVMSLSVSVTYSFNVPVFLKSFDLENSQTALLLLGAICGSSSKLIFGFVSDFTLSRYPRLVYVLLVLLVQSVVMVFNSFIRDHIVVVTLSTIVYFSSLAAVIALTPMLIPEYFGTKHFASIWGIITVCAGLAGLALSYSMGALYDMGVEGQDDTCYGLKCFRMTSIISTVICVIGFTILLSLYFKHIRILEKEHKARNGIQK